MDLPVPHDTVRQRNVEQVVDVHDPLASVSGRNVEQVMDVPELHGAPSVARAQQLTSRAAAAWLDAPQVHSEGFFFFALFPGPKKVRRVLGSRVWKWHRTPARPRHQLKVRAPGSMATSSGLGVIRRKARSG